MDRVVLLRYNYFKRFDNNTAKQLSYLVADIVETELDFVGRPQKVRSAHTRNGVTTVTLDNYDYDHMGRLLNQTQCIGDAMLEESCVSSHGNTPLVFNSPVTSSRTDIVSSSITLRPGFHVVAAPGLSYTAKIEPHFAQELVVFNDYDALGQLVRKKVGGSASSPTGLQTVNYTYNVRGWLTKINNPSSLGDDLFAFGINYNTPTHNGIALYNGNIAETEWKTANDNALRWYRYGYDALNRLTSAVVQTGHYNMTALYDKNGNITELNRNGHTNATATTFGPMDRLGYSYDAGNKLTKVLDIGRKTYGFTDSSADNQDYWYDANGNMVRDLNKGIGTASINGITYNHLNLPEEIKFDNNTNKKINYIYDALGIKLQKVANDNGSLTTTDYAGNYVYENNALQFFSHPEGYVMPNTSGGYDYVYQYRDHLGNVRLSYTEDPSHPGTPTIIEENNYYPFGLKHKGYNYGGDTALGNDVAQKWKFGGKEYDESLGLETYDFGARNYNPDLGRWMNIDPLSDKYSEFSPYVYVVNNPLRYVDLDGEDPIDPRTGRPYKVSLNDNSVIRGTIDYDRSNPDYEILNRTNSNWQKLFPRGQRSGDTGWASGNAVVRHDLTTDLLSSGANDLLVDSFGFDRNIRSSVHATETSNPLWRAAAESGTYAFVEPTFAESEMFFVDRDQANIVSVEDNYVSQITTLTRNDNNEFDVTQTDSFDVSKGEVQTREKKSFFGLVKKTEKFRVLNVTQTTRTFENNKEVNSVTKNFNVEEIIK